MFHSTRSGILVHDEIIEPDTAKSPEAHLSFFVTDPERGIATMQIGLRAGWSVPARFQRKEKVVHFSYEFPGRSPGFVTISRASTPERFPAVSTDHRWEATAEHWLRLQWRAESPVPNEHPTGEKL